MPSQTYFWQCSRNRHELNRKLDRPTVTPLRRTYYETARMVQFCQHLLAFEKKLDFVLCPQATLYAELYTPQVLFLKSWPQCTTVQEIMYPRCRMPIIAQGPDDQVKLHCPSRTRSAKTLQRTCGLLGSAKFSQNTQITNEHINDKTPPSSQRSRSHPWKGRTISANCPSVERLPAWTCSAGAASAASAFLVEACFPPDGRKRKMSRMTLQKGTAGRMFLTMPFFKPSGQNETALCPCVLTTSRLQHHAHSAAELFHCRQQIPLNQKL